MNKIYELENCSIKVNLEDGLVRLFSDNSLWKYLDKDIKPRSLKLVQIIKADYKISFNKSLKITDDSLMVEIWAHVYSQYTGLLIKKHINGNWIKKLVQKGIERAEIIDCGEKHKDSNRWVWDFLSHLKSPISAIMPRNISRKNLKN